MLQSVRFQMAASIMTVALLFAVNAVPSAPQQAPPRTVRFVDHQVEFQVRTAAGGRSDDLLLIVFSDRSAQRPVAPSPLFDEDVIAEFAFSGRDAVPAQTLTFTRRVPDIRFL